MKTRPAGEVKVSRMLGFKNGDSFMRQFKNLLDMVPLHERMKFEENGFTCNVL